MADIFISYSSKDREKAEQLTELLGSAGLSVWIDQSNLEVSASWSKEIVQAINDCKAFVVLLSPASLESHNVIAIIRALGKLGLEVTQAPILKLVKDLRVADQQAAKEYKRYQGTLPRYVSEMSIRYFIQGDVPQKIVKRHCRLPSCLPQTSFKM